MTIISTSGNLFVYGKSTSGMLRPDDVIFYHPLDDSIEFTTLSSWSGDAAFLNGKVSQAMTSKLSMGSFGSDAIFDGANLESLDIDDLDSSRFIVVWEDSEQSKVGVISGSLATFGVNSNFTAFAYAFPKVASFDNDTFVVLYEDLDGGNGKGATKIGIVSGSSGTTITYGSKYMFQPTNGILNPTQDIDTLDENTFIVAYADSSDSLYGKAKVGIRSGTDITYGSGFTFASSGATTSMAVTSLSPTKFAIAYVDTADSMVKVVVGTINDTDITFGTPVVFYSNGSQCDIDSLDSTSFVIVLRIGFSPLGGAARIGTVSGDTITIAGDSVLFDATVSVFMNVVGINSDQFVVSYRQGTVPKNGYTKMGTILDGEITFSEQLEFLSSSPTAKTAITFLQPDNFVVGYVASPAVGRVNINTMDTAISLSGVNYLRYPSASGYDRISLCMWGQSLTQNDTSITVERGYEINMTSTNISIGGDTAIWNDSNIEAVMSGFNTESPNFLVLDFENTGGTTWNLKTSLDGASFVDQGIQNSGTQPIITTNTVPHIFGSGVNPSQWIDEVVLWGGDKNSFIEFTDDELIRLYQLGQIHNESMDNYDQHGIVISGICSLYTYGSFGKTIINSKILYIQGHKSVTTSGELFIDGLGNYNNARSLFIRGITIVPPVSGAFDAKPIDWFLQTSDHNPQIIGTFEAAASTVTIQVWDTINGQNIAIPLTSSGCYQIGNTGRWGWSTVNLQVSTEEMRQYFYLMTSDTAETFDGQFFIESPESIKWFHPGDSGNYLRQM